MTRLQTRGPATARSILITLASLLWLAACGGGGGTDGASTRDSGAPGAGSGSESPTGCDTDAIEGGGRQKMSGVVSEIGADGHLIVGRTNFATNGASVTVDGKPARLADLHRGDVVIVTGTIDTAQEMGCAKAVYADASIVGPVSSIDRAARSLRLLSLTIQLRDDAVLADLDGTPISLSDLQLGDTVRVSGVPSAGVIVATRVQRAPRTESYFLAGLIASLEEVDRRFSINGIAVKYDAAVITGFPEGRLQEGDPVRVSGTELISNPLRPDAIQYIDYDAPVSVLPATAALQVNESIQFRASVASGDPVVTWSVLDADGQSCSANECGLIDSTGLYTAPAVVQVESGVLVRAALVADPASSDTVSVFVYQTRKKIVFMSARDGNEEIYSVNVDGTELTRLTDNDSYDGDPAWSPDGLRIAFTSDRASDGSGVPSLQRELYVMDADGSNVVRRTFSKSGAWRPTWSPDGTRIAYQSMSGGSADLFEVAVDGGARKLLFSAPGWDGQPAWSPDGSRLALVSDWFAYDFVYDVFLINADGSGFTPVRDGNIFDHLDYEDPAWSPDGSRIALAVRKRLDTFNYATRLGVMNADGSNLTMLPPLSGTSIGDVGAGTPSWSPDGTMIAYTDCTFGRCRLSWIKADGSARGEIVEDGHDPDWQR